MGRALFSQKYITTPAVRENPEPVVDICEKWSVWNQFDPDSEDFFKDAQLEHFVDGPITIPTEEAEDEPPHVAILESVTDSSSSPSATSNDDSLSDNDSPMAVGADDPAALLAGAYTPVDWQQRFLEAGSLDARRQERARRIILRAAAARRLGPPRQLASQPDGGPAPSVIRATSAIPVFIPPASYRNSSTSTSAVSSPTIGSQTHEPASALAARSPISRRTVSITPINIPSEPSLPSPVTPDTPSTPPPRTTYPIPNTLSPSPAPNVTPRIYTWSHIPTPSSPTRDSPLTNPHARMSLSRIDTMAMSQQQFIPVYDRH